MAKLTEQEKKELKNIAKSKKLKEDLRKISNKRYNPFIVNGKINIDKYLDFLNEYNRFINHNMKPFKKILTKKNVL